MSLLYINLTALFDAENFCYDCINKKLHVIEIGVRIPVYIKLVTKNTKILDELANVDGTTTH